MLEGAPTLGELEGVTWYTPQEIEDIRNRRRIQQKLDRRGDNLGFKPPGQVLDLEQLLKRIK